MVCKTKNLFNNHKFSIFIFAFLLIYNFLIVNNFGFCKIDPITYTYHLVDYSLGFCTKLLPGAIYNAIFPTTDASVVNLYFNVLYHVFLIALALLAEKFLKKFESENRTAAFILIMFFITGPATFSIHSMELGMLDTYWLFFSAVVIIFLQNKVLKWFVPAFLVLSVLIHISAFVSFVPFMALLVLADASRNGKIKKSNGVIFVVSVVAAFAIFLYFIKNEEANLALSLEEFRNFIHSKNLSEWEDYTTYYDYSLYKISYLEGSESKITEQILLNGTDFFSKIINYIWSQAKITFQSHSEWNSYVSSFFQSMFVTLPITALLYKYILSNIKNKKASILRRFVLFCSLFLMPLTLVSGVLCSPDFNRWFSHSFTLLFTFVLYDIYKSDEDFINSLNHHSEGFSLLKIMIYFVLYSLCIVTPYC